METFKNAEWQVGSLTCGCRSTQGLCGPTEASETQLKCMHALPLATSAFVAVVTDDCVLRYDGAICQNCCTVQEEQ